MRILGIFEKQLDNSGFFFFIPNCIFNKVDSIRKDLLLIGLELRISEV